jgi:ribosomal protein L14
MEGIVIEGRPGHSLKEGRVLKEVALKEGGSIERNEGTWLKERHID